MQSVPRKKDKDLHIIQAHVYSPDANTLALAKKRTERCPRCQCSSLPIFPIPSADLLTNFCLANTFMSGSKPILEVLFYTTAADLRQRINY